MHSGIVLPAIRLSVKEEPPLVAMTSPWFPIIATLLIAAVVGAWATAPLVATPPLGGHPHVRQPHAIDAEDL